MTKIIEIGEYKFAYDNAIEYFRAQTLFTKEEGTIAWLQRELKPGDVFYDVGANVGCYTIVAAKLVGETGMVYAFEPHVGNAASLLRNVALNKLKNVRLLTVALGDQDGVEEFNYAGLIPGSSGSQLGHTLSEHGEAFAPAAIELKITSALAVLCDDCYALRTHSPSLIKIDVDGNELAVLRGMVNIQGGGTYAENAGAARSVQVELHPKDAGEIIVLMNNNGYKLIERHYTASGKKQLEKGADPLSIVHNAVFQRLP